MFPFNYPQHDEIDFDAPEGTYTTSDIPTMIAPSSSFSPSDSQSFVTVSDWDSRLKYSHRASQIGRDDIFNILARL